MNEASNSLNLSINSKIKSPWNNRRSNAVVADNYAIIGSNTSQYKQLVVRKLHPDKLRPEWKLIGHYFLTRINNCSERFLSLIDGGEGGEVIRAGGRMVNVASANIFFLLEMAGALEEYYTDGFSDVEKL